MTGHELQASWFHDWKPHEETAHLGSVVVIDACAATTNMAILLSKHPRHLIIVNEQTFSQAQEIYPNALLIGESKSLPKEVFAWNNQLTKMYRSNATEKDLLWMSINGSKVIERVMTDNPTEVIAGSFLNLSAVVEYLHAVGHPITIIMSGDQGAPVAEDRICAEILTAKLQGRAFDWEKASKEIEEAFRAHYSAAEYEEIPALLDHFDESSVVPRCIRNVNGFLEVVAASS